LIEKIKFDKTYHIFQERTQFFCENSHFKKSRSYFRLWFSLVIYGIWSQNFKIFKVRCLIF